MPSRKINARYDSRYESQYKQRIQELTEYILEQDYGETITFGLAAKYLGYNLEDEQENKKFKSTMSRIKNFLIDYGYILKSISGVGYYILKPKHIADYTYRNYVARTLKSLNKADRILKHTDTSLLTDIRMKEYNEINELNNQMDKVSLSTINKSDYYKNKDYYNGLKDD